IKESTNNNIIFVDYDPRLSSSIRSDSFYLFELNKKLMPLNTVGIEEMDEDHDKLAEYVIDYAGKDFKVAVIANTIGEAKKIYRKLDGKGLKPVLLTSRMTPKDREDKIMHVREGSTRVLVSTQVLEVGVDLSFDVVISELSSPSSVVQRLGRLARGTKDEGYWLLFYTEKTLKDGSGIYNPCLVQCTKDFIESALSGGRKIHWHLPKVHGNDFTGYMELIDDCWSKCLSDKIYASNPLSEYIFSSPFISSQDAKKLIGNLREDSLCTIYLLDEHECPNTISKFVEEAYSRSITTECEFAFNFINRALSKGCRVVKIVYRNGEELECSPLSESGLKKLKDQRIWGPPPGLIAFGVPKELYDEGIHGEGLKDPEENPCK
ncbi:helicase-related protein, partial [Infirmifilum sp.]|uniref:helicase-related protein n=1 Tax=Infirmifilum sp. TaxID=2856575 RepID=UPI003D0E4B0E